MSYDQFWLEDPWLVTAYRAANDLIRQRKSEEMWLQGLYFHNALGVSLSNALSKKGARPKKYMEEPFRLVPYTEEEKAAIAETERQKTIEYFNRLAARFESKSTS